MNKLVAQQRAALGTFLLGLAALAIFDFWFPGILLAAGFAILVAQGTPRLAWSLLITGGVFWLRDVLYYFDLAALFPLAALGLGVALLLSVDLRQLNQR